MTSDIFRMAALYLVSEDGAHLELVAGRGADREDLDRIRRRGPIPLTNKASSFVQCDRDKKPLQIEDMSSGVSWRTEDAELRAAVEKASIRCISVKADFDVRDQQRAMHQHRRSIVRSPRRESKHQPDLLTITLRQLAYRSIQIQIQASR